MEHGVAIEVPVSRRVQGLHQAAVTGVDQVALGARAPGDEQGQGEVRVGHHVMTALRHFGGKALAAIQAVAHCVVAALAVVACRQQQRLAVTAAQLPAGQQGTAEQTGAETKEGAALHVSLRRGH